MSLRKLFVTASLALIAWTAAPAKASADWIFTPFIGSTFGGSANVGGGDDDTFKNEFERKLNYGASLAFVGSGALGFELDFGYSPNFFRTDSGDSGIDFVGDGNVTTAMANLVIGAPHGGIRPYVSGGVGLIKSKVDDVDQFFSIDSTDFGFNAGAGIGGFFSNNVGLRGDIRFFRSLRDADPEGVDIELGQFKFWRGTVGISFKF
jgi:opacity protein-like surface antigen